MTGPEIRDWTDRASPLSSRASLDQNENPFSPLLILCDPISLSMSRVFAEASYRMNLHFECLQPHLSAVTHTKVQNQMFSAHFRIPRLSSKGLEIFHNLLPLKSLTSVPDSHNDCKVKQNAM
jgi:hypothetical protein